MYFGNLTPWSAVNGSASQIRSPVITFSNCSRRRTLITVCSLPHVYMFIPEEHHYVYVLASLSMFCYSLMQTLSVLKTIAQLGVVFVYLSKDHCRLKLVFDHAAVGSVDY